MPLRTEILDLKAEGRALAAAQLALRDQMVLAHLPMVKVIAAQVHRNLPTHVEMDDLLQAGILGLFSAANKYRPDTKVPFPAYASHRVKGAILDSLRDLDWASRDMRRRHRQLEAATNHLATLLQRSPTELEIAEELGLDTAKLRTIMLDLRNVGLISASTRSNEDMPPPDFPSKPETYPDSICAVEQLRSILADAVLILPERDKQIVSLYYTGESTMKEIGTILGINESRVSQIHKRALAKLAIELQANGIYSSHAF